MPAGCTGAKSTEPPSPSIRKCCLLNPIEIPVVKRGIADPANLGPHKVGGGDIYGIAYTCAGGFIDLAHLRDMADLTQFYYKQLTVAGRNKAGNRVPASEQYPGSFALLLGDVPDSPTSLRIEVARSMAYDESVFHEIETYWDPGLGGHASSFSPEDLSSNFLGTYVAGQALLAGGEYASAVTTQLNNLMQLLSPVSPADTALAFGRISGKWVSSTTSIVDTLSNDYLLQRNFNVSPIGPCVLADAPGCLQSLPFPSSIPTEFAAEVTGRYDMTFMVPIGVLETFHKLGISLKKSAFGPAIDVIKADAKRRYGDNFQSCAA